MAENRGVFRLRTLRTENVQGDGVPVTDAWVPPAPIATADASYMVGGLMNEWNSTNSASNVSSQTDKITYATSTTSRLPGSNLTNSMYGGVGMSSLVAMYSGGGPDIPGSPPNQTNVQKLTYATGSWALLPHAVNGLKVEPREATQGVGDGVNFGYFFGGENAGDGSPRTSYTQKYTFAYDVASRVPGANLSYSFFGATAAGTQEKAYVTGGENSGWSSFRTNVSKFTYSGETMADVPGLRLSDDKYKGYGEAAAANSQYIWYAGGSQTTPQGGAIKGQTTVSRIDMSADTIQESLPSTQLTYPTFKHGGVDNGSDGYFAGGNNNNGPSPGGPYSSANKLTFSNGTMAATPGANLTQAKSLMQTAGPRQYSTPSPGPGGAPYRWVDNLDPRTLNVGYWSGGGGSPTQTSSTDQLDFNSNTNAAVPGGNMPRQGTAYAGVLSDTTKVLISGGEPSGGNNDFIKWTYATKTFSFLPGAYPGVKRTRNNDMHSIVQPSVGYIVAGQNDSGNVLISSTDKVTFATETATTVPGLNYSYNAKFMTSWGDVNLAHGYAFGGDRNSPASPGQSGASTINKLTYATETLSNIPANTGLSPGSFQNSSTSSSTHGYLLGGRFYPGYSAIPGTIRKFNFSTETRSNVPAPSAPEYRVHSANATGNSTHGYYGGGTGDPGYPHRYTTIQKLSFETETYETLPEAGSFPWPGPGRSQSAAFSQMSNGKPVASAPTPTPTVQTVPLLSPSATNTALTAFGYNPKSGIFPQSIFKTNLTTDTNQGEVSTLSIRRYEYASNSTETHGYFHAGKNPSGSYAPNSDKVNYATDSRSQIPGLMGSTTGNWRGFGATGNPTHGYSAGGLNWPSGYSTHFLKMTWSSDSTQEIPATLNQGRIFINATGNREVGYWIGGEGNSAAAYNTTDKMVYSSDTASVLPSIDAGRSKAGAVSGSPYSGYLLGGENTPSSNTNSGYKINLSSETGSVVPSISLNGHPSYMKYFAQASGNTTDGYTFGGGSSNPSGNNNTGVQKLSYSSETTAYVPGAALPLPVSDGASTTARDHSISQNPVSVNV
jgi:hypothetical protein